MSARFGPTNPAATYIPHVYPEQTFETGEVLLNYAVAGGESSSIFFARSS